MGPQKARSCLCLNPYFFGKCSTAIIAKDGFIKDGLGLNPYFFGKCSTASLSIYCKSLRYYRLNPYFVGKCSTAIDTHLKNIRRKLSLNPYFVGKCSTACTPHAIVLNDGRVLILILLENALRQVSKTHSQREWVQS